jgi:hypothetical protein
LEKDKIIQTLKDLSEIIQQNPEFRGSNKIDRVRRRLEMPNSLLIMGEFKAGKSTLINTILEEDVLKEGRTATTAVKTLIRYGKQKRLFKVTYDGEEIAVPYSDLGLLTSELNLAGVDERKQVDTIIVELPIPLLKKIVLIDSPGLNSVHDHHTEQANTSIRLADNIFWVFKYNSVGKESELTSLKKLKELGKKPLGIINMLDEHDDDDATGYIKFEYNKLKSHLTGMIGVSALEAKSAKEENDDELWKMSGFPELMGKIENVSNDTQSKIEGSMSFLQDAFDELYERLIQFLENSSYPIVVRELNDERKNLVFRASEHRLSVEKREKQLIDQAKQLNELYQYKDFVQLAKSSRIKLLKSTPSELEYLNEWITLDTEYERLKHNILDFNNKVNDYAKYHEENFEGFKRFTANRKEFANFRQTSKKLKETSGQLKQAKEELLRREKEVHSKFESEIKGLNEAIQQKYLFYKQDFDHQQKSLEEMKNKQIAIVRQHESMLIRFQFLVDIQKKVNLLIPFVQTVNFPGRELLIQRMKAIVQLPLPHLSAMMKLIKEVENEHQKTKISAFVPLDWKSFNLIYSIEKMKYDVLGLFKIPKYFSYNIRPAIVVGAVGVSIFVGTKINFNFNDSYSQASSSFKHEDNSYYDDQKEEEIKQYLLSSSTGDATIGYIHIGNEDANVYEDTDTIALLNNYYVKAGTTWEAYEQFGDWYRIENNVWVLQETGSVTFEPNIIEYMQQNTNGIAEIHVNAGEHNVYSRANIESEIKGYVTANSSLAVHAIAEPGWVQLDEGAWMQVDDYNMSMTYHYLENAINNSSDIPVIYMTTEREMRAYNDSSTDSAIVGYVKSGRTFEVYETPNSNWARVGNNIWLDVSEEKWNYEQGHYGAEPIGQVRILVDNLNVRDQPFKQGNVIGQVYTDAIYNVYYIAPSGWYELGHQEYISNNIDFVKYTSFEDTKESVESYEENPTDKTIPSP